MEKMKGADVEAIQIKGPQRKEKEKIKGVDAEAIQIKGPQKFNDLT